jgi:hypothetical protein
VAHEDWLPTFAAAAGAPDIKEKLLKGVTLNGRTYKNHLDGYNMLDYLSGKVKESPRKEFIYVNDDGEIVAARYRTGSSSGWKTAANDSASGASRSSVARPAAVQPAPRSVRAPQHNSNTYNDWFLDRVYVIIPITEMVGKFLKTIKDYPPSQTAGSFNLTKMQKQIEEMSKAQLDRLYCLRSPRRRKSVDPGCGTFCR